MAKDCNQTCLPSSNSAYAVVHGIPGGLLSMGIHFLGRSVIIGTGLFVVGYRGKEWLKGSVAAAAVVEATLLGWALFQKRHELKTVPVDNTTTEGGELQPLTIAPVAPRSEDSPQKPNLVDPNWDITTWRPQ